MKRFFAIIITVGLLFSPLALRAQTSLNVSTPRAQNEVLISLLKQLIALLVKQLELLQAQLQAELLKQAKVTINPTAIVYLNCHYKPSPGREVMTLGEEKLTRGTGVIINPQGYIVTARHLVDPEWSVLAYPEDSKRALYMNLKDNYLFDFCETAPPTGDTLPTAAEIRALNPGTLAGPFEYAATLYFKPAKENISESEFTSLDFALLKITRVAYCQKEACPLPALFPYTPVRLDTPPLNHEVLSFGYPIEAVVGYNPQLKGAVGTLKEFYGGDSLFKNKPLTFQWIATSARQGRSGSPIFAKNYVIGIELGAESQNTTINYGLGIPAIQEILRSAGQMNILSTR